MFCGISKGIFSKLLNMPILPCFSLLWIGTISVFCIASWFRRKNSAGAKASLNHTNNIASWQLYKTWNRRQITYRTESCMFVSFDGCLSSTLPCNQTHQDMKPEKIGKINMPDTFHAWMYVPSCHRVWCVIFNEITKFSRVHTWRENILIENDRMSSILASCFTARHHLAKCLVAPSDCLRVKVCSYSL